MTLRRVLALLSVFLLSVATSAYVDPTTGNSRATAILRPADIPERNWDPGHRGVDLALDIGDDVLAAEDGIVAFAGLVAGMPVISIDHADGIRTTYQPVHAHVSVDKYVRAGEVIGRLAPHPRGELGLHWGARTGKDQYINPLSLLDTPVIRLKPVDAPA